MKKISTPGPVGLSILFFNIIVLTSGSILAFNPPVDTAGPLTVEIEGPEQVTETEKPLPIRVVLRNKEEQALHGKLRLVVVDRWRIEPENEVEFSVPAKGECHKTFVVIAERGTYSAHYPLHAYADFSYKGKQLTARRSRPGWPWRLFLVT